MRRITLLLTTLALLALFSKSSPAAECSGDACDDVSFEFKNGCYLTTNVGMRRIKVTRGPYSFTLQRGETHILFGFGNVCVTGYFGSNTANYESRWTPSKSSSSGRLPYAAERKEFDDVLKTQDCNRIKAFVSRLKYNKPHSLLRMAVAGNSKCGFDELVKASTAIHPRMFVSYLASAAAPQGPSITIEWADRFISYGSDKSELLVNIAGLCDQNRNAFHGTAEHLLRRCANPLFKRSGFRNTFETLESIGCNDFPNSLSTLLEQRRQEFSGGAASQDCARITRGSTVTFPLTMPRRDIPRTSPEEWQEYSARYCRARGLPPGHSECSSRRRR